MVQGAFKLPHGPAGAAPAVSEPASSASPSSRPLSAAALLAAGGDERISLDETTGLNRYGCQAFPDVGARAYGSSTASVISVAGYAGAERLAGRLNEALADGADPADLYAAETGRVRAELTALLGLDDWPALKTLLGPSGTDLHRIVAGLVGAGQLQPPLVIVSEAEETGSGVAEALGGVIGPGPALRAHVSALRPAGAAGPCQIQAAPGRGPDGRPRATDAVDQDVMAMACAAAALGRRVLLVLMDVSKTGLISPSPACALALKQRFPDRVEVLVDACQLRLAPATLKAYLRADFMVAVTGSKFMTGPTFSAALILPEGVAARLSTERAPMALAAHAARAEWPGDWPGAAAFPATTNFGLILRWQAALDEMRPFLALPEDQVEAFFEAFSLAAAAQIRADPALEALPQRPLDRSGLDVEPSWDRARTIHPFVLKGPGGPLSARETLSVHRLMGLDLGGWAGAVGEHTSVQAAAGLRVQLGQPVTCGPLSALRLCASARLAVDALTPGRRGVQAVIDDGLACLDKVAWLSRRLS